MKIRPYLNVAAVLSLAVSALGVGCGGSGSLVPSPGTTSETGSLSFKIQFPASASRQQAAGSLPFGAASVRIRITTAATPPVLLGQEQVVAAPSNGNSATVDFPGLHAGPVVVSATANADLQGLSNPPLATASKTATIVSGQVTNVTLSFVSTITQVVITPSPVSLNLDGSPSSTLTATARTASGQAVPGAVIFWSSSNSAFASISAPGSGTPSTDGTSQATVTGHVATPSGSPVTIQAQEFSSGKVGTDAVTVS